jgi:serine/threonine protein kinase
MLGRTIDGEFEVKELLGEGSYGSVYLCEEKSLKRLVAIKMLKTELATQREIDAFLGEARLMAGLNHPHVVQIYRFGEYEGRPFLVLEYLRGKPLRQLVGSAAPTYAVALEIMAQVALGLRALHEIGLVHRDLSSNNIMVSEDGTAKIVDLGMARKSGGLSSTQSGTIAGTIRYLAPEVIDGKSATIASDVFSFGINLYELLTGQHPFDAEHHMSVLFRIVDRPHRPLSQLLPHAPADLSQLIDQCLQKNPQTRLTDLAQIAQRLRNAAQQTQAAAAGTVILHRSDPREATHSRNPYLNRVMIKRTADFFGRRQEIKRIAARLNATPPGSVSIVGERKIGKSSLLNYIYNQRVRSQQLEDPNSMIMVYVDLQQQTGMTLPAFVETLLGIASLELRGRLEVSDCSRDLDGIKMLVERLHGASFRLVLLLDEFEAITGNTNFDLEFFSFLRFLANHYNVAYITSSAHDLQSLCHTQEIRDSPFFNIFTTMHLSVFQESEALDLIRLPSAEAGRPLERYERQILDMAGRFPFFLQIACCHALEYMEEHSDQEPDFREIERRFYEEARLHYRFLWDGFDEHERSVLRRIVAGRKIPDALDHVRDELQRKHYVAAREASAALFSSTFRNFIESEVSGRESRPFLQRILRRGGFAGS